MTRFVDFMRPPLSLSKGVCGKEACLDHPSTEVKKNSRGYGTNIRRTTRVVIIYMYITQKVQLCATVHVLVQYISL
jgi:hypothetical protein